MAAALRPEVSRPFPGQPAVAFPARQRGAARRFAPRVAVARLDNVTNNVSPIGENQKRVARRGDRLRLRNVLWRESTLRRVQWCGRARIKYGNVPVFVQAGVAHLGNVQLCGSVHSCPVCAAKIRQQRATEIDRAVRLHLDSGGSALFQTLTLPHDFGDHLASLLKLTANAFRKVVGGRGYLEDKADYSISGTIRASETTFGKAGAHPHLHVIFFCDRELSNGEIRTLHARLFSRWAAAVESVGYRPPLIGLCPIERVTARGLGGYVQKLVLTDDSNRPLGMEMTRHDLKTARRKGRTPFQVLRDFADTGDCADLDLWHEWERASQRTQSLTWSKGLKARFKVKETSDEELAAQKVGGDLVTELTPADWELVKTEHLGVLTVLEIAETGGATGIDAWLAGIRERRRALH